MSQHPSQDPSQDPSQNPSQASDAAYPDNQSPTAQYGSPYPDATAQYGAGYPNAAAGYGTSQPGQAGQQGQPYQPGQASQQGQPGSFGGADAQAPAAEQYPQYAQPAGYPQAQAYPQAQQAQENREPGFFRALFDLKFEHFVSVKFASLLFVIAIVVSILQWALMIVGGAVAGIGAGSVADTYYESGSSFAAAPLMLAIFLGWIPSAIQILLCRVGLEFLVSGVRTAQNTTKLVHFEEQRSSRA